MTMQRITCMCTEGRRIEVDAEAFGEWAAHPGIDGDDLSLRFDWWVVTHIPSERTIVSSVGHLTEEEAIELASALGERVPPGIVPPMPTDDSFMDIPLDVKRAIRSVIYDVRGRRSAMTAKLNPARCVALIAAARNRFAVMGLVGSADALDLANQLEASLEELSHATAADGDSLSKASRAMCDTVLRQRDVLLIKVRELSAEIEALRCGDLGAFHDGELEPGRAEAFRMHLGACAKCETGLHGLMQEDVAVATAAGVVP